MYMPKQADRMKLLGTETAFEVLAEVKKLQAKGKDIVSFAIGEPDFDTPKHIVDACINALYNGETHYGPSAGIMPLREAIAKEVSKTRNIKVSPNNVVITPGAKPIMFHSIHALVNPGDEVLYPNPGFPIYESVSRFVGGKPVPIPIVEERDFSIDTESLISKITPKTKLLILNSPHNPTGGMLSTDDLQIVANLAKKHDFWVLSDEVYSRIVYQGKFSSIASIPGMQERTIILDGFSKTYAMTGWRIGYGVMQQKLCEAVARLETNCESCTATFTQHAALAALKGPQDDSKKMVGEFRKRKDIIVKGLNDIKGVKCLEPKGAFYVFPNVTEAVKSLNLQSAKQLQQLLLYEGGVAVLPRTSFGEINKGETEQYLRLSYATSREQIEEGLLRIKSIIES